METTFEVVLMKVDDLVPYIKNPKAHPPDQIDKIARSIKRFGLLKNVVIDKDNELVAGHGTVLAAQSLGIKTIPVHIASHLDEAMTKALRIADNQTAEADWLFGYLSDEFKDLDRIAKEAGDDNLMQATGFTEEEIDRLLAFDKEPTKFLKQLTKNPTESEAGPGDDEKEEEKDFFPMVILLTFEQRNLALLAVEHAKAEAELTTQMQAVQYIAQDFAKVAEKTT